MKDLKLTAYAVPNSTQYTQRFGFSVRVRNKAVPIIPIRHCLDRYYAVLVLLSSQHITDYGNATIYFFENSSDITIITERLDIRTGERLYVLLGTGPGVVPGRGVFRMDIHNCQQ